MNDRLWRWIPIRIRLTLWYVLLIGTTFTIIAFFLIARFQNSLVSEVDRSLQAALSRTIVLLDEDIQQGKKQLTLEHLGQPLEFTSNFVMRLLSPGGEVWDTYGAAGGVPGWSPLEEGFATRTGIEEEDEWRMLTQPVMDSNGQVIGWVQAAQSMLTVSESLQDLREQLLLGIPLLLVFAGLGGYFLADRALSPITRITNTAQLITARNLSRRIGYTGSLDEIGDLARIFDQMLERLQSSFERERRFVGDAAHELRTPLTVLKGQIEVTLNQPRTPTEHEVKLQELLVQVDRLIQLSNALLFLSRSDQNQLSFHPTSVKLKEMLDVMIEQFQPLANEKDLKIRATVPDDLRAYGDKDHLIRLFMNLLENGMKYTPAGGEIVVTASQANRAVHVTIHNTGSTIPPEHLPHLFERFYRVDADRSSQTGGSGLGLAIAKEIVRLHNGEITVKSETGEGVTFSIYLPVPKNS